MTPLNSPFTEFSALQTSGSNPQIGSHPQTVNLFTFTYIPLAILTATTNV